MRERKFVRMGAILLMLIALVMPVAPAAANDVQDDAVIVRAADLAGIVDDADCVPNTANNQTRYFITLVNTNNTGVTNASITLLGAGTLNGTQTVQWSGAGDRESEFYDGSDNGGGVVENPPGSGRFPNGSCQNFDPPFVNPFGFGTADTKPRPNDGRAFDYASTFVQTNLPVNAAGEAPFQWRTLVRAPGYFPQLLDTRFLVDGLTAAQTQAAGLGGNGCALGNAFAGVPNPPSVGCHVSLGTVQLVPLVVPQAGRGSISGVITDVNGFPAQNVEVVIYRQYNQDPSDNATGSVAENTASSVLTDQNGFYFVNGLWPGAYSVTAADTRWSGGTALVCQPSTTCGVQPATRQITLTANQQWTQDFAVVTGTNGLAANVADMVVKQAPGQTVGANLAGVFGYVVDGSTGTRIGQGTPGVGGYTFATITFVPVGGTGLATVTATTDANGRYQALIVAGQAYTATVALPPGVSGSCTAQGNLASTAPTAANPSGTYPLFPCTAGVTGTDRFSISATGANIAVADRWNDGATFVLAPTTASIFPGTNQTVTRQFMTSIPGIFRNPDTSYTGVDVETIQVRVANSGPIRTVAQIEWYSTSSDDIATLVKTDGFDLNPAAVGIFTRSIIPDGCTRCMAQVYSLDQDGPGLAYGVSALHATVSHRVVDAANAVAGGNGITFNDIVPTGVNSNHNAIIPLVFKNWGGGVHKWNSIITACLTRGVTAPQPVVLEFVAVGEARGGTFNITRSTNPGGCLVLNLGLFDPDDPDYYDPLAGIPDGTYSVSINSTAGTLIPVPPERPGGFFGSAINYTITGKMATQSNGSTTIGNEAGGFRELYGPLLFKNYNDWNSGITVANFRARFANFQGTAGGGGGGAGVNVAIYGEDGTLFGVFLNRQGDRSGGVYYLPTLPIQIPNGFRGTSIVTIADNTASSRTAVSAHHVNYERNQAMSYNFTTQDQVVGPLDPFNRPCERLIGSFTDGHTVQLPPGSTLSHCLTAPDVERRFGAAPRGSGATFEVGLGPTTGIRLFNPDVLKTGRPAFIVATYVDAAGVFFSDSYLTFSIPSYGTGTIFTGADQRLPDIFDGTVFIQSTEPIVGIGNVVDYRVTDRDASYTYNLPNQTGRTN